MPERLGEIVPSSALAKGKQRQSIVWFSQRDVAKRITRSCLGKAFLPETLT